ncbi:MULTISPECIES: ABC transporter substrate-binding protein [Sinorhizobium]|uniref:ABC transporter substrate-binding protein n=1 Tax=Sinorhizobium TaxID=28105 RepID=UPI00048401ED|nr:MULTISPECIES: ABC transporter substrate-binding protein [Sinorhizobium]WOS67219.1 ABC transporter substrate-binding protein [Sinorhizobium fredii GR64]
MTFSRRDIIKLGVGVGVALSGPSLMWAQAAPAAEKSVRMVMSSNLSIFDPYYTTATITHDHAMAIYDMLFAFDSQGVPQPQMVESWHVSDDKKSYTFKLRDGLTWHDSSLVTAADCTASLQRWGHLDDGPGPLIMERIKEISQSDDKTFTIVLTQPLDLLIEMLANTGRALFIMREQDAKLPPSEQVTANIGSGPFKFNQDLAKPGVSFTYDRNENYVPRSEPVSGFAGGKVVNVDRVIWVNIADQQTALAALQAGEIDFVATPPADLYPAIEADPNLELQVLDTGGTDMFLRMNCLQKPFDSVKARQAILHLVDQEAFMRVVASDPKYVGIVTSVFGSNSPYSNDESTGWYRPGGDPEKATQLFQEAGYGGEKVVILQPTDRPETGNAAQYLAAQLRKIGVNAELAPSDWSGVLARRANKGPVEKGGWSIFITTGSDSWLGEPLGASIIHTMTGEDAWVGWPKSDEYEALRRKWIDTKSVQERQALARKMQRLYWDIAGMVFLGRYTQPCARRKTLTGLISGVPDFNLMWNIQKA